MRTSWHIFKLFGIEIKIDSSWIFIFGLITWALAGHYFPSHYPRWPHWQYWGVGIATSVLLFASVLAHELTHSLVARSKGEEVRSIKPTSFYRRAFLHPFHIASAAGYSLSVLMNEDDSLSFTLFRTS